jgi:septin family protein
MNPSEPQRRSSFGMLLRRSKSGEFGSKGKKAQALREAELERQRAASRIPPKLPEFARTTEQLSKSFGPELRPDSRTGDDMNGHARKEPAYTLSKVPVPPIPNNGFDPYARTESMTHRGRYSYASSAVSTINSPRRVRRRKDPTPLNILILGTRGSGKTSFLEFLKTALALPAKKRSRKTEQDEFELPTPASGNFIPHYLETEIDGERIGLTLWDSEGLEKNIVDLQLREMSAFVESKFEETFAEEMKVVRSPGVQDTHIHAAFLVLDPSRLDRNIAVSRNLPGGRQQNGASGIPRASSGLDEDLDMQVLRMLQGKTTVIPVISKADTVTTKHMNVLKRTVWDTLKKNNMDPLETLGLDDEDGSVTSSRIEEEAEEEEQGNAITTEDDDFDEKDDIVPSYTNSPSSKRLSTASIRRYKAQEEVKDEETPFLPLSIISPDLYEPGVVGRQFPWGFADPYNEEHCDFTRLKEAVFSEWRAELREASREQWYEGWRTTRLKHRQAPYHRR